MATHPESLYGYSYRIRNLLRGGGPSVDDDAYSLRLIAAVILSQAAKVRQDELYDLDNRGLTPDQSQMVSARLTLIDYQGIPPEAKPVKLKQALLPQALSWRGNPAIFGLTTRPELPGWGVKETASEAIRRAIKKPYIPAYPAGWLESGSLCVALPLSWSGVQELYARFIPAAVNIRRDGAEMDVELEPLTITQAQWAKIEPLVLTMLNPMLQTTANRDTVNQGKDDSAR